MGIHRRLSARSVVGDPLRRRNTNDNTAIIHTRIVDGDRGSRWRLRRVGRKHERAEMFNPSAETEDIKDFIISTVRAAGSNACPPMVIGWHRRNLNTVRSCEKALCSVSVQNPDSFMPRLRMSFNAHQLVTSGRRASAAEPRFVRRH